MNHTSSKLSITFVLLALTVSAASAFFAFHTKKKIISAPLDQATRHSLISSVGTNNQLTEAEQQERIIAIYEDTISLRDNITNQALNLTLALSIGLSTFTVATYYSVKRSS